jgi:multiple sugar transport system permease protein
VVKHLKKSDGIRAIFYLAPAFLIIGLFQIYPIIQSFTMSFYTDFDYLSGEVYARGLDNFYYVLGDPDFHLALKNTSTFVLFSVPLSMVASLFIAVLLNSSIKLRGFFRSVYFLPFVTSSVAVSMVWRWIFSKNYGLINQILSELGFTKISWLNDPEKTIFILVILSIWRGLGYKVILFLAGLQAIDEKYYEAAKIDGANSFKLFSKITLPLLKPTLFFVLITSVISSFKIFDEVFVMYDKKTGPLKSGLTIVYYIFDKFYNQWQFSIAAAATFILFVIILAFTIVQLKIGSKQINK